jgi:hypothetical protein
MLKRVFFRKHTGEKSIDYSVLLYSFVSEQIILRTLIIK